MDLIFSIITPILNCLQLLPQLIKTYRTKKVDDLSMASLILILSTNLLWFIYGGIISNIPLIASSVISLFINSMLFGLYIYYSG